MIEHHNPALRRGLSEAKRSAYQYFAPTADLSALAGCSAILINKVRHGSHALDSASPPARSSPVMLSAAKDLAAARDRPFAALRVTLCDCSNGQVQFVQIEPCLKQI